VCTARGAADDAPRPAPAGVCRRGRIALPLPGIDGLAARQVAKRRVAPVAADLQLELARLVALDRVLADRAQDLVAVAQPGTNGGRTRHQPAHDARLLGQRLRLETELVAAQPRRGAPEAGPEGVGLGHHPGAGEHRAELRHRGLAELGAQQRFPVGHREARAGRFPATHLEHQVVERATPVALAEHRVVAEHEVERTAVVRDGADAGVFPEPQRYLRERRIAEWVGEVAPGVSVTWRSLPKSSAATFSWIFRKVSIAASPLACRFSGTPRSWTPLTAFSIIGGSAASSPFHFILAGRAATATSSAAPSDLAILENPVPSKASGRPALCQMAIDLCQAYA
jgi:hypothetical protein